MGVRSSGEECALTTERTGAAGHRPALAWVSSLRPSGGLQVEYLLCACPFRWALPPMSSQARGPALHEIKQPDQGHTAGH